MKNDANGERTRKAEELKTTERFNGGDTSQLGCLHLKGADTTGEAETKRTRSSTTLGYMF